MKITHTQTHTQTHRLIVASIAIASSVLFSGTVFSQTPPKVSAMPEPARWTQEDVTPSQKLAAAKKELVAAKFEATNACKSMTLVQHSSCMAEAESIYSQDLAAAQKRFYPNK